MFAVPLVAVGLSFGVAPPPADAPRTRPVTTAARREAGNVSPPAFAGPFAGPATVVGLDGTPTSSPAVPTAAMPNNGAPIKYQQACPGPVAQPFQRQPRVGVVPPCQSDGGVPADATSSHKWVVEFDEPAHFPLPRFDQDRKAVCDTDGLVIYEGMRLTVDEGTSTYDLDFTATVPGCETVLRLQLLLTTDNKAVSPPGGLPRPLTLTLPPIRLKPADTGRRGEIDADTFHVQHRGYSSLFLHQESVQRVGQPPAFGQIHPVRPLNQWQVRRAGTARFGTPVAVDDSGR